MGEVTCFYFLQRSPLHGTVKNKGFVETQVLMPAPTPVLHDRSLQVPKTSSICWNFLKSNQEAQTNQACTRGLVSTSSFIMGPSVDSPSPLGPRVSVGVGLMILRTEGRSYRHSHPQQKGCPSFQSQTPSAWSIVGSGPLPVKEVSHMSLVLSS